MKKHIFLVEGVLSNHLTGILKILFFGSFYDSNVVYYQISPNTNAMAFTVLFVDSIETEQKINEFLIKNYNFYENSAIILPNNQVLMPNYTKLGIKIKGSKSTCINKNFKEYFKQLKITVSWSTQYYGFLFNNIHDFEKAKLALS